MFLWRRVSERVIIFSADGTSGFTAWDQREFRLVLLGSARHDPDFGNQEPARSCRIYR